MLVATYIFVGFVFERQGTYIIIIKREQEIIGKLIERDEDAKDLYIEVCRSCHNPDEEFIHRVYEFNLRYRPCEIHMGSGIDDVNGFLMD